jgi:hypothetical protein
MKIINNFLAIILISPLLYMTANAQPSYLMNLANGEIINNKTFEFEVFIQGNDPSFILTSYQCSFTFNPELINGGILTFDYIGHSELANGPIHGIGTCVNNGVNKLHFASNAGSDTIFPSHKKVGRFRLTNTVPFGEVTPDIFWDFYGSIKTILTGIGFIEITDSTKHTNLSFSSPVPVELIGFSGKLNGNQVELKWGTISEKNNKGFEIEIMNRQKDWKLLAFIEGSGSTLKQQEYSYIDKFPAGRVLRYRLKQIDLNGSYSYSNIVEIDFTPDNFELFQNYPNPFNPNTTVKYSLPTESRVSLKIYNILGELINTLFSDVQAPGNFEFNWNPDQIASGNYILSMEAVSLDGSRKFNSTKKMQLLK